MNILRLIKNWIGDKLLYSGCPGCDRTFWMQKTSTIRCTEDHGIVLCSYCMNKPIKQKVRLVYWYIKSRWRISVMPEWNNFQHWAYKGW